jgi:hypothetical protein
MLKNLFDFLKNIASHYNKKIVGKYRLKSKAIESLSDYFTLPEKPAFCDRL